MPTANLDTVSKVVRLIQGSRMDLSTEKDLQQCVEQVLTTAGIRFEREKPLSPRDIPDFLVEDSIVLECKMRKKSRPMDIYRQLCRYAEHDVVTAIVLATNVSMGLPESINDKPAYMASLSRAWL